MKVCEVVFDVDRGYTAGTGGRDGLAVGRIDDVAGGENAGDAGLGSAALDGDGSFGGQLQLSLTRSVRGSLPMATKTPVTARSDLGAVPGSSASGR